MAEAADNRDTENNWVIPNTEGLLVETVGAENKESSPSHEDIQPKGAEAAPIPASAGKDVPAEVQEIKGAVPPPPVTEAPPHQEQLEIPPDTAESPGEEQEPPSGLRRRVGAELEEVSCSSSEEDAEGLRKRVLKGPPPPASVGPTARETAEQQEDLISSLNINKCLIAAVALVGLAVLIFTGGFITDDEPSEDVITRSMKGDAQPETITDIQDWLHEHADQFTGDPSSLQVMNGLLDKVAKENQEIRHMQAKLQAQKEELEALVQAGDGIKTTPEPQTTRFMDENVRLKEALLREETDHLTAKEELQNLQEKLEGLETNTVEKETLVDINTQLKAELDSSKKQMESFLSQKETLVAESQMLRQELDKQRLLVASIRQDFDSITSNKTTEEGENVLQSRITEMSNRLAMEAQRSETWEKKYGEHAEKRKQLVGEEKKYFGHKEWKKGDKWSNASMSDGQFKKPHFKHNKEHAKRWTEEEARESQYEEWKSKKYEDKPQWRDKKHRHGEREKSWTEDKERPNRESENWKDKGKEHGWKDSPHQHENEKNWKDKHARHHHGEAGDEFHPRKGQREFSEAHKHGDKRKDHGDKASGKEHRHHDHNKFWKKLSDHQYRVPEGCSGLEECAKKDGLDLFYVDLKPVQRKQFEEVLKTYLAKSELSKNLPELLPLLDGFFEGSYFAHHKIRFKDFVDDVEDFLEDLAKKETGSDDIVDDFERYVYTNFFGEAANKRRSVRKDSHHKSYNHHHKHNPEKLEETSQSGNQSNPKYHKDKKNLKVDAENPHYKSYKGKYNTEDEKHKSPSRQDDDYDDDDDDRKDHKWKKTKKYNKDERYSREDDRKTWKHNFDKNRDVFNEQRQRQPKKPKYEKDHDHGYRSYNEHHEDYNDQQKEERHFHEHKPYKKHPKKQDWDDHHYHKDKFEAQDHHNHDKPSDQTFLQGKDGHERKYKYSQSATNHSQGTEQPFHHEHKPYWKKHEKDVINERYRSQPHKDHHHEYKPWKEGERGHGKREYDSCEDSSQSHHSKPYHDKNDESRQKRYYDKDDRTPRPYDEKHDDRRQKPYPDQHDSKPKTYHDKHDDSRGKPYHKKHEDSRQKPYHKEHDDSRGKPYHKEHDDSRGKPYHKEHDDSRGKPYYNEHNDNQRKPYHDKHDNRQKPHFDEHNDNTHRSYYEENDDGRQKRMPHRHERSRGKNYDKQDENKGTTYSDKHGEKKEHKKSYHNDYDEDVEHY
ncbi:pre-B-cell leukemia transcription factor-interacting protein 1 isoform X2 [Hyperolius riggenbachi]|uniref:pre-B-cell leukemia transcription factor-interacting protein 1 isoform X2 n=1 Tax=Hyperolius riggenbachi TaxID=752182 RepID=UPI0035A2B8AD